VHSDQPPEELLRVTSPEQYRALGHPLRHRLLFALGQRPATISQLSAALGSHKGNVAHHLKVLRDAGMVAVVETRQVRGGTEQYYQRTARRLEFPGEQGAALSAVMLQAVAEEISTAAADPEPVLLVRNVRLTQAQAQQLASTLTELASTLEDAGDGERRYGLLLSLYQPRQSGPSGSDPR
jgi:DNA-binding transcriptional ArsR family regulator